MGNQPSFTRRVCAVLLADVTGFSAMMGQDDERTAQAIQTLRRLIDGIVTEAAGHYEPVAGDAIFATFDSVLAAVQAALQIQERVASTDFGGTPLQVRIGVHLGDVLVHDGQLLGDAINIAARLESLATPGTVCISDGVYRQVRNKFDVQVVDLGPKQLKNISDRVHAYLLIPQGTAVPRRHSPTTRVWTAAVLAVTGVVAAVLVSRTVTTDPIATTAGVVAARPEPAAPASDASAPAKPVALGVMGFKMLGEGRADWRREALRDGLNTHLSQLSGVKVYSKEFIDFLITRQGLTEVEAATKLGIAKMLSGSVVHDGTRLRIETHVVDVSSGVMESSYATEGEDHQFPNLQEQLTLAVITQLKLPVTEEEKAMLLAKRGADTDALRALLEAEGVTDGQANSPQSSGAGWHWLSGLAESIGARPAFAEDDEAQVAVRSAIEQYRQAIEQRRIDALSAIYTEFPPEQQLAQQRYFDNVRDLKVAIENIDVAVIGDEAVASYTRVDDFIDSRTGRPIHVSVRLTKILRKHDTIWKLMPK